MVDPCQADIGLPTGTAALALRLAHEAAAAAGPAYAVDQDAVLAQLLMPLVVGARPPHSAPRPVPGGGFVHDDTGAADAGLVGALMAAGGAAEEAAAAAQACWLPVTPYRSCRAGTVVSPVRARHDAPDPAAVRVLDLTAMWAGPLCTRLLAEWGATVTAIEPSVRPDGLRGSPAQFAVLDRGKRRIDLDLRRGVDRAAFEQLVAESDLLVESFSRRVLPNLGYADLRSINPAIRTLSIRAYPAGSPEAAWVAYGRGVHATSGLGMFGGRPQPASIAYPDPLTGFAAFSAALGALGSGGDVEVSLAAVVAPLTSLGERPLGRGDPRLVRLLAERTGNAGRPPIVHVGDPASSWEVDAGTRSSDAMRRQAEPAGRVRR